jgi:hypothetical protein
MVMWCTYTHTHLFNILVELWLDLNPGLGGTIPTEIGLRYNTLGTCRTRHVIQTQKRNKTLMLHPKESLSLTDCSLSGTIPTELGNLLLMRKCFVYVFLLQHRRVSDPNGIIEQIWLYGNNLEGSIPGLLADLQFMSKSYGYSCRLVYYVRPSHNFTAILELQQNRLEGSVPLDMCGNFPQNNVDVSLCVDCDLVECCCCTCCTSNSCR